MALNRAIIPYGIFVSPLTTYRASRKAATKTNFLATPPLSDLSGYGGQEMKKPSNSGKLFWAKAG
jgi:hypothetical protein